MTRTRKTQPVIDGARMMAARRAAGISRDSAAAYLGVSRSAVNGYEQGRADPSARVLVMMAWLYKVKIESLIRDRVEITAEFAEAQAAIAASTDEPDDDEQEAGIA
jgi:transcriptional regulator with XRE-family HTH domain